MLMINSQNALIIARLLQNHTPSTINMHLATPNSDSQTFLYPLSPLQFLILLQNQHLLHEPQSHPPQPELPPKTKRQNQTTTGLKYPSSKPGNPNFLKNTSKADIKTLPAHQKTQNPAPKRVNHDFSSHSPSEFSAEMGKLATAGQKNNQERNSDETIKLKCALKLVNYFSKNFKKYSIHKIRQGLAAYYAQHPLKLAEQQVVVVQKQQILQDKTRFIAEYPEYSYLKPSILPPYVSKEHRYGVNGCPYYDMVLNVGEQRTKQDQLKLIEQRFVAFVFCNKGYGLNHYREAIGETQYEFSKERYKSLIGTTIRLAFRKIQEFLLYKMKRNISALKRVEVKALLTPLLNINTQFDQKTRDTFNRCIRTIFRIQTQPALDTDVLLFYKALVIKTRGANFAQIIDIKLNQSQLFKLENKIYENNVLWTPALEREYIEIYLKRISLSGIKQQFQKKYCPQIDPQHFDHSRLRARCDKIFTSCLRKVNFLLDRAGLKNWLIALTDRLKKIVSRSPIAVHIRNDLCQIYLQKNTTRQFICGVVTKIRKMVSDNKHLFDTSANLGEEITKCKIQQSINTEESAIIANNAKKIALRKKSTPLKKQKQTAKIQQDSFQSTEQLRANVDKYLIKMQEDSPNPVFVKLEEEDSRKAENIFYSQSSSDQKADEEKQTTDSRQDARKKTRKKAKKAAKKGDSDDSMDEIQRLIQQQQRVMKGSRWIDHE